MRSAFVLRLYGPRFKYAQMLVSFLLSRDFRLALKATIAFIFSLFIIFWNSFGYGLGLLTPVVAILYDYTRYLGGSTISTFYFGIGICFGLAVSLLLVEITTSVWLIPLQFIAIYIFSALYVIVPESARDGIVVGELFLIFTVFQSYSEGYPAIDYSITLTNRYFSENRFGKLKSFFFLAFL